MGFANMNYQLPKGKPPQGGADDRNAAREELATLKREVELLCLLVVSFMSTVTQHGWSQIIADELIKKRERVEALLEGGE